MSYRGKKRALPTSGREEASGPSSRSLAGKKVRFGAGGPSRNQASDDEGDDEEPADDLEGPSSRRNAVIAPEDGGSSDEEEDDDGAPANKASVDDDDDMFNSAPSNKKPTQDDTDKIKDKGLRLREGAEGGDQEFIKLGDLDDQEFQVLDNEDSDDQEDFEDGDIHANDDDAPRSRRSKKGMGYQLSGFNMKEELSEGRMTADGSYIANKTDPFARHDAWLDGVSDKKAIKVAKAAKEAKAAQAAEQDAEQRQLSRPACMKELVEGGLVTPAHGETVLGALQRLGQERKSLLQAQQKEAKRRKRVHNSSQKRRQEQNEMEVDGGEEQAEEPDEYAQALEDVKRRVDRLTTLAGTLLDGYGETEVYDWTFDDIVKDLRLEGEVPRGWEPKVEDSSTPIPAHKEASEGDASSSRKPARGLINRNPAASSTATTATPTTADPRTYEYRWTKESGVPAEQMGRSFGPFGRNEMESWIAGGYFGGPQAERIEVRQVGGDTQQQQQQTWARWT